MRVLGGPLMFDFPDMLYHKLYYDGVQNDSTQSVTYHLTVLRGGHVLCTTHGLSRYGHQLVCPQRLYTEDQVTCRFNLRYHRH